MIRLSTCVSVLLACGSGLYLYQTKHQAQVLDRQIEHTVKAIAATRMQTRELTASWTLLGSPDRLQQLSDQFLGIKPVLPSQFVAMSDLDLRLPAPRALDAPSSATPGDAGSDTPPLATTEPTAAPDTPTTPAPTSRAASATPSPAPVGAADATRVPSVAAAATASPIPATEPGKTQAVATVRPAERKPSETPRPGHEVAQAHPTAPRAASPPSPVVAELERPARPAPQRLVPAPMTGSLLGMAHIAVPAPVPLPVSTAPSAANGN
jgi:hypothetical protein